MTCWITLRSNKKIPRREKKPAETGRMCKTHEPQKRARLRADGRRIWHSQDFHQGAMEKNVIAADLSNRKGKVEETR